MAKSAIQSIIDFSKTPSTLIADCQNLFKV